MGDGARFDNLANRQSGKPLTAAFVRNTKTPGKYHDGNGLILRVDRTGAKRWIQRIVIRGKRTEIGLGSTKLVSLSKARDLAVDNRLVGGSSPSGPTTVCPINDARNQTITDCFACDAGGRR